MLENYEGKTVIAETDNHRIFCGEVTDYVEPCHNENGKESIIIKDIRTGRFVELYEKDLKSIEIMHREIKL